MNALIPVHIAVGLVAILAGSAAVAAPKWGRLHARAGTGFFAAMLLLGITASLLEPYRTPPGSPVSGIMVCYFVATSWVAARRRGARTGWFEIIACAAALGLAALIGWAGMSGAATTPVGRGRVFAFAGFCLLAGGLDLNAILRRLNAAQRIARHLWRMCFAFFIATGSFFLGQQDVMPQAVRGSPILFSLAFAPLAFMAFWLVRIRMGNMAAKLTLCRRGVEPLASNRPHLQMEI